MGMFSEIAIEGVVKQMVSEIKKELLVTKKPCEIKVLKKMGRFTLTLFDYSTPDWAKEYQILFSEKGKHD